MVAFGIDLHFYHGQTSFHIDRDFAVLGIGLIALGEKADSFGWVVELNDGLREDVAGDKASHPA